MAPTREKVMDRFPNPDPASDGALALQASPATAPAPGVPMDLPPATKAQVHYWRELCGQVSLTGAAGMRDHEWPPHLAPAKLTLRELAARKILVRRSRAWHLRRGWYTRLCQLRATAVLVPQLQLAARPRSDLPTYAELQIFESVCRWLDSQPKLRARLPMENVPEIGVVTSELLRALRKHRLVRHTQDCAWALSPTWKPRLLALWQGVTKCEGERTQLDAPEQLPYSLGARIDTWYLNRIDERGLTPTLAVALDDLQAQAQHNQLEVDTPWAYDGTPLRMYQHGSSAAQSGSVSWTYILRNVSLMLVIRRKPLGGIVAQARLGSECLTRLTARRALDELDTLIRRMWSGSARHPKTQSGARWQVSQVHLAHDVANTTLKLEQLDRYVSRSRRQATYEASQADLQSLYRVVDGRDGALDEDLYGIPEEVYTDAFAPDLFLDAFDEFGDDAMQLQEDVRVEDRAVTVYRWGRRLSGVTWSPGGEISVVAYDKVLQMRQRQKTFLHPEWRARGWDGVALVTRFEAGLRRGAFRRLGLPAELAQSLDDPWVLLQHLPALFSYVVGQPPHEEAASCEQLTEAVDAAWLRRVVPAADTNRSRWPTDPVWQVVQAAPFDDADPATRRLMRREQHHSSVEHLDVGAYGYLVSRTAALHPDGETYDVSRAIGELARSLTQIATDPKKAFGELVRERRRQQGLPVPPAGKILPLVLPIELEVLSEKEVHQLTVNEPLAVAGQRMREAWWAIEAASVGQRTPRELELLEEAYKQARASYHALRE